MSKPVWRGTNALESWSWNNCEGNKTIVEVHTLEPYAELFINGKSFGRKKTKAGEVQFKVRYQSGKVTAVTYDARGNKTGESSLESAGKDVAVKLLPEETVIIAGEIVYIPVVVADKDGIVECNADTRINITVEGGSLLAFGSANPCTEEKYDSGSFTSYYGRALAIVHGTAAGTITVKADSALGTAQCRIEVKETGKADRKGEA